MLYDDRMVLQRKRGVSVTVESLFARKSRKSFSIGTCGFSCCGGRTRHRLLANALTLVKELRPGACRVLRKQKKSDKNRTSLLRRQDSNMRPPGYEPGELPTAPLRDFLKAGAKLRHFSELSKYLGKKSQKNCIFAHFVRNYLVVSWFFLKFAHNNIHVQYCKI